ncbi:MAG: hypothetical protein WDN04_23125 [Rhodospirillales bacterium]
MTAFGLFVQPQALRTERITVKLDDGQSITKAVSGNGGAAFFGFVGSGVRLSRFLSVIETTEGHFAFGDFRYVAERGLAITPDVEVIADSADLVANAFKVTLNAPYHSTGYAGSVTVTLVDNLDDESYLEDHRRGPYNFVEEGKHTEALTRPQISISWRTD